MTKLEEKLIHFGYQKKDNYYYKDTYYSYIEIELDDNKEHIIYYYVKNNKGQSKKVFKASRLEEKLKELGYTKLNTYYNSLYEKSIFNLVTINIKTNKKCTKIIDFEVDGHRFINKQSQLDENQKAFDTMKKDLEVLKEYETI